MTPKTILFLAAKNIEIFYYKLTGQQHRIVPYKVLVEVTNRCNSKCLHCDIWKIEKHAHTQVDLESMERFLKKMHGKLLWMALSGGEVSLYKEFPSLLALVKKHNPNLRILTFTTNGLLPQKILQYALLIRQELKSDVFITISLDGDEETHDEVRGVKGNYRKAQETFDLLTENGIPCHFGITVSQTNASFIHRHFAKYRDSIKAVTFLHTGRHFFDRRIAAKRTGRHAKSKTRCYPSTKTTGGFVGRNPGETFGQKSASAFCAKGAKTTLFPAMWASHRYT